MNILEFLNILSDFFIKNNGKIYFIGGASRNIILNKNLPSDLDFSTNLHPEKIEFILKNMQNSIELKNEKIFIKILTIGKDFGTISFFVYLENENNYLVNFSIEITSTRKDINCFGRSAKVEFCEDFYIDSERRDFTINAIYISLKSFLDYKNNKLKKMEILDFHNSLLHLKQKKILFIGNAEKRIQEDYLRIIRYIRFCTLFNNQIDLTIGQLIFKNLENLKILSKERKRKEIYTILSYQNYQFGIYNLIKYKILDIKINKNFTTDIKNNLKKNEINIIKLLNLIFRNSNNKDFINNLIYLKENLFLEKEEIKIADFYIKNTKIINYFLTRKFSTLKNNLIFRRNFANSKANDYKYFSNKNNWIKYINFIKENNIFIKVDTKNINKYMERFFIYSYISEFYKNEYYLIQILQNKKKFSFLKKKNDYFIRNKNHLSLFLDKITDKNNIGKYLTMSIVL